MSQWYAIRSATCREKAAAEALAAVGVTVFLPMEARWGYRAAQIGRVRVEQPLLRGYLFVLIEPADVRRVLDADYVHDFLGYTDEQGVTQPLPIPLAMIIELQADERAGRYDRTLYIKPKYQPRKGERVKVTAGPWLNFIGKVIATPKKERAHIMIEGPHGRGVTVDNKYLKPAA